MWFRNLQIYTLQQWHWSAEALTEMLSKFPFKRCEGLEMEQVGWIPPREGGPLVHSVGKQLLLTSCQEKKWLPSSAINDLVKERCAEYEEQQGHKPGRKTKNEIKEKVTDELLPRAFSRKTLVRVWIDPLNGWLVVDASSGEKADLAYKMLLKAIDTFPGRSLRTAMSPVGAMTDWLVAKQAPAGFTVDQDAELSARGEAKAKVRYVNHSLDSDDVRNHIRIGKQCTRLGMTWNDRISFVLTAKHEVKQIKPLTIMQESAQKLESEAEQFDADFQLMAGELNGLLQALVQVLGGEESNAPGSTAPEANATPVEVREVLARVKADATAG